MSVHDDHQPGGDHDRRPAPSARPLWRRRRVVAGALGAVVVLGSGGYLLTAYLDDGAGSPVTDEVGALGSVSASVPVEPSTNASSAAASIAAAPTRSPVPPLLTSATTTSQYSAATPVAPAATKGADDADEQIRAAREAARKDGVPLQRPLKGRTDAVDGLSTRTEATSEGTIRITTAKGDLTGKQDQLMAADDGRSVGKARCTQRLRFSEAAQPREIPTVLLCWRTSAERSVVTLVVSQKGKPSAAASTEVINREWTRLG